MMANIVFMIRIMQLLKKDGNYWLGWSSSGQFLSDGLPMWRVVVWSKHSPPGRPGGDDDGGIADGGDGIDDGGDGIDDDGDIDDGGDIDDFPIPCGTVEYEGAKSLERAEVS